MNKTRLLLLSVKDRKFAAVNVTMKNKMPSFTLAACVIEKNENSGEKEKKPTNECAFLAS